MAKDRLKRRIAEALAGASVRDELQRLLASHEAPQQDEPRAVLHPILDNVKDPILTVDPDGHRRGSQLRGGSVARCADRGHRRLRHRAFLPATSACASDAGCARRPCRRHLRRRGAELIEAQRSGGRPLTVEVTVSRANHGPTHVLRAVHARRHGAAARRASAARERGALSDSRRETRPRRSSCSTSIAASSSTPTTTPSSCSSCRAKSCCAEGPRLSAPSFRAMGYRPRLCITATWSAPCAGRAPFSSGCTATVRARRFRARCGSFACRRRSNG